MSVVARFETGGVRGEICFFQASEFGPVEITVRLNGLKEQYEPQIFDWEIRQYPIRYSEYPDYPCDDEALGNVYEPEPGCFGATCSGNLGDRHGRLAAISEPQKFTDNVLSLFGPNSIIGRPLVIREAIRRANPVTCANIGYQGISLMTLRAGFNGQLNGDVIFRRQNGRSGTTFNVDLYDACNATLLDGTPLRWSLRVGSCDGPVLGNDTHPDEIHHGAFTGCSRQQPRLCPLGDLTTKCGAIEPEQLFPGIRYRAFCNDDQLGLIPFSTMQRTYLVFENSGDGVQVGCQPWHQVNQLCARVSCVKRPRISMDILFFQNDPGDRTYVRSYITGLDMEKAYFQIRRDPVENTINCRAGGLYDKPRSGLILAAAAGENPTGDVLPVGTMTHKTTSPAGRQSVVKQDTTSWLPLFGPFSIIGRSLAIIDVNGRAATCCNIEPVTNPSPELITSILGYQEQSNDFAG
jgi:hypothetical protein